MLNIQDIAQLLYMREKTRLRNSRKIVQIDEIKDSL